MVVPCAVPVTVAMFGISEGQAIVSEVRREHEYVQVSPGSRVTGEVSPPLPLSTGAASQFGSVTCTAASANGTSPGFVTESV
jgi:hypothetical protein